MFKGLVGLDEVHIRLNHIKLSNHFELVTEQGFFRSRDAKEMLGLQQCALYGSLLQEGEGKVLQGRTGEVISLLQVPLFTLFSHLFSDLYFLMNSPIDI